MIAYLVAIAMIPVCMITAAIVMTIIKNIMKLKPTPGTLRGFGILFGVLFAIVGLLAVNGVLALLDTKFEPFQNVLIGAGSFLGGWFGARSALERKE
jgi:hypothetical protein